MGGEKARRGGRAFILTYLAVNVCLLAVSEHSIERRVLIGIPQAGSLSAVTAHSANYSTSQRGCMQEAARAVRTPGRVERAMLAGRPAAGKSSMNSLPGSFGSACRPLPQATAASSAAAGRSADGGWSTGLLGVRVQSR